MNDQLRVEARLARDEPNHVSSFETGFISLKGAIVGVCIKYAMFDRQLRIAHWPLNRFSELYSRLNQYSEMHWEGSDMQRTTDPQYVARLPPRHPYHTVVEDTPKLEQDEIGASGASSFVANFEFVDRGKACEIKCTFRNGDARSELLPEYIAMNLFGYLKASIEAVGLLLNTSAGGSA